MNCPQILLLRASLHPACNRDLCAGTLCYCIIRVQSSSFGLFPTHIRCSMPACRALWTVITSARNGSTSMVGCMVGRQWHLSCSNLSASRIKTLSGRPHQCCMCATRNSEMINGQCPSLWEVLWGFVEGFWCLGAHFVFNC